MLFHILKKYEKKNFFEKILGPLEGWGPKPSLTQLIPKSGTGGYEKYIRGRFTIRFREMPLPCYVKIKNKLKGKKKKKKVGGSDGYKG